MHVELSNMLDQGRWIRTGKLAAGICRITPETKMDVVANRATGQIDLAESADLLQHPRTKIGYVIVDRSPTDGAASRTSTRECPMCGEDALPCWECISTRVFSEDWCAECDRKVQCQAGFDVR